MAPDNWDALPTPQSIAAYVQKNLPELRFSNWLLSSRPSKAKVHAL
jgi:hypothetical protein